MARQIGQHPRLAPIPIALLTGQFPLAEEPLGIWRTHSKPVSLSELQALIAQSLEALGR